MVGLGSIGHRIGGGVIGANVFRRRRRAMPHVGPVTWVPAGGNLHRIDAPPLGKFERP